MHWNIFAANPRRYRGLYDGTVAQHDDFVVYRDHRGRYRVDLVGAGGTHVTIGPTRGYNSVPEAMRAARREAHNRGINAAVIWGMSDDVLHQIGHAPKSHQTWEDPTTLTGR